MKPRQQNANVEQGGGRFSEKRAIRLARYARRRARNGHSGLLTVLFRERGNGEGRATYDTARRFGFQAVIKRLVRRDVTGIDS